MELSYELLESPIGVIRVVLDGQGVRKVARGEEDWAAFTAEHGEIPRDPERCAEAVRQLEEYFRGERREFDLPLSVVGTEFRKQVWAALQEIPYGEVCSYQDIAVRVGKPKGTQAVGQANRANPLPVIIPCHRVIGKKGDLVGYSGPRTDLKTWLLELEGALKPQ